MTAPVIDLEKWVAQKNNKGHAEREDRAAFERKSHSSILAFEAGLINGPRQQHDPVCEFSAPEGAFRGYLSQLHTNTLQGAGLYLLACAAATAWAGLIFKQSAELLHFGLSLVARPSLQWGDSKCSGTPTRTPKQQTPGNFGEIA